MSGPGTPDSAPVPIRTCERGPNMTNPTLTAERLREVLHYSPGSGEFHWLRAKGTRAKAGDLAGYLQKPRNYRIIQIDKTNHYAHRLAWLYVHGVWPVQVDHVNGIKDDNRLDNLRESTQGENLQNLIRACSGNQSGFLGVSTLEAGAFGASICVDGKKRWLGTFATPEDAHAVYLAAKAEMHPGWGGHSDR